MAEMVERVARAIVDALSGSPSYIEAEELSSATVDGCFDLCAVARAAIAAMREPTEAMCAAGARKLEWAKFEEDDIYIAMIDTALTEQKE